MTRAATSPEITKFRSNQWSKLYAFIYKPTPVFACRINQSFASLSAITEITYDTVTVGAYTDVEVGMTMYVGSAAGLSDIGTARIRKVPTSTKLFIGIESAIEFADNLYLTVVDEFTLWSRHLKTVDENNVLMDTDIPYIDQNERFDPIPLMGPDSVLFRSGSTVNFTPTAADSWVFDSTISGYSWSAPGASATSGMTSATPTITYNVDGQYRVSCTVTATNGKSSTGHRVVFVYSSVTQPKEVILGNMQADAQQGGWSFEISMYNDATLTDVKDFSKVILFATDFYNEVAGSIGPITGYENIVAIGWIDGESIDYSAKVGFIKFKVDGPQFWLNTLEAYSTGLVQQNALTDWKFVRSLTLDKALWNALYWRSTVMSIMDVYLSSDTRTNAGLVAPEGSIWSQINYFANKIMCTPRCNRYGQLFFEIDTQYLPVADRSSIPTVVSLTKDDWRSDDQIKIERSTLSKVALVDTAGTGDSELKVWYSRAPGETFAKFGEHQTHDQLMLTDQAQCNMLAGMILAQANNLYPTVEIPLLANNRLIDITPNQYVALTIDAADNPRGISWTAQKLIPRQITYTHNPLTGKFTVDLSCEAETDGPPGIEVHPATIGYGGSTMQPPIIPPIWPIIPPLPGPGPGIIPPGPGPTTDCDTDLNAPANGPFSLYMVGQIYNYGPTNPKYAFYPCIIRSDTHINQTRVAISGVFQTTPDGGKTWVMNTDNSWYTFQALAADGSVLASAVWDTVVDAGAGTRFGTLSLPSSALVYRFKLSLTAGSPLYYVYPPMLNYYAIPVTSEAGIQLLDNSDGTSTPPGGYALDFINHLLYAVESCDGSWNTPVVPSTDIQEGIKIPGGNVSMIHVSDSGGVTWTQGETAIFHGDASNRWIIWEFDRTMPAGCIITFDFEIQVYEFYNGITRVWYNTSMPCSSGQAIPFAFTRFVVSGYSIFGIGGTFSIVAPETYSFDDGIYKDNDVVAPYVRIYFNAHNDNGDFVRVNDTHDNFGDNTGTIHFRLWRAAIAGDHCITLQGIQLYNICSAQ